MPGSGDGGAMTAACLRLASVMVVVARWSTDLDVIPIITGIRCTAMIKNEWIGGFLVLKKVIWHSRNLKRSCKISCS